MDLVLKVMVIVLKGLYNNAISRMDYLERDGRRLRRNSSNGPGLAKLLLNKELPESD